jgi:hypothetical protein
MSVVKPVGQILLWACILCACMPVVHLQPISIDQPTDSTRGMSVKEAQAVLRQGDPTYGLCWQSTSLRTVCMAAPRTDPSRPRSIGADCSMLAAALRLGGMAPFVSSNQFVRQGGRLPTWINNTATCSEDTPAAFGVRVMDPLPYFYFCLSTTDIGQFIRTVVQVRGTGWTHKKSTGWHQPSRLVCPIPNLGSAHSAIPTWPDPPYTAGVVPHTAQALRVLCRSHGDELQ